MQPKIRPIMEQARPMLVSQSSASVSLLSQPTHPSVIPSMLARQGPIEPAPRPNTNISHVPTTAAADAMPEDARYHML